MQEAEQPFLDGLAKRKRASHKSKHIPAEHLPIARVILDVQAAHLGQTFDYLVSQEQDETALAGCMVRVRFGARRLNGVIWSRAQHSSTPMHALRYVDRVQPGGVIVNASLRADLEAIAQAYGGTVANIMRLAVPMRVAKVDHEQDVQFQREYRFSQRLAHVRELLTRTTHDETIITNDACMLASYESAANLRKALLAPLAHKDTPIQNVSSAQYAHMRAFIVDALPGSGRWAQDVAWMIASALCAGRQALAVLPTIREVNDVMRALMNFGLKPYKQSASVQGMFDGDVARLTAYDTPADRYRAYRAVSRGLVSCVLGTRAAMYAPVGSDALFVIVDDNAYQYADGMMPYAQARGVVRLRARRHGGIFVSMGWSRSAISDYEANSYAPNADMQRLEILRDQCSTNGPSQPIVPLKAVRAQATPWVRHLNRETLIKLADPSIGARIPHTAVRIMRGALEANRPVLCVVPQDADSTTAICSHCRRQACCMRCARPLRMADTCPWCGAASADWSCKYCHASSMNAVRLGVNDTARQLAQLFRNVPIVVSSAKQPQGIVQIVDEQAMIVVAAPSAEPRVRSHHTLPEDYTVNGSYQTVVILDAWNSLYATGLDARLDTLTAWMRAASMCASRNNDGTVLIVGETYGELVCAIQLWDPCIVTHQEYVERLEAGLPPLVATASIWGERNAVMQTVEAIGAQRDTATTAARPLLPTISLADSEFEPLLGMVSMKPQETSRDGEFEALHDRVKAVVRVPYAWRDELARRLHEQSALHAAKRHRSELRFSLDPKDLLG